jgi:hypothetical protein
MRIGTLVLGLLAAGAAGGCASPTVPGSPSAAAQAAEQARREERLKIMQQYWYEQTAAPGPDAGAEPAAGRLLDYPAGTYAGIAFGPRRAADPSLAEPDR